MSVLRGNGLRRAVGLGLAASFVVMAVTGLLRFQELLGLFGISYGGLAMVLPVYEIRVIHDWVGLIFLVLIAAHLAMNRRWLASAARSLAGGGHAAEQGGGE